MKLIKKYTEIIDSPVHPITSEYLLNFSSKLSPPFEITKPMRKNRMPRPKNDAIRKGINVKPVTPEATVNIL